MFAAGAWLVQCNFVIQNGRMEEPTAATNVETVLVLQYSERGK